MHSIFKQKYHIKNYDNYDTSLPGKIHSWYYELKEYGVYLMRGQATVTIHIDSTLPMITPFGIAVSLTIPSGLSSDDVKQTINSIHFPPGNNTIELSVPICTVLDYKPGSYNSHVVISFYTSDTWYAPKLYGPVNIMTMSKIKSY